MSRTTSRRLLAQWPLTILPELAPAYRLPIRCLRPFSNTSRRRAGEDYSRRPPPPPSTAPPVPVGILRQRKAALAPISQSPSLHPRATSELSNLSSTYQDLLKVNRAGRVGRKTLLDNIPSLSSTGDIDDDGNLIRKAVEPHQLHIYATRHNVHITVARPPGYVNPDKRGQVSTSYTPILSFSAGNIGFRKSGRKHYDSAFQLASYVMSRMQEAGINRQIRDLEVYLRGFGAGREAVTKALLGTEGRFLRGKVVKVSDATRLKFGGTRSKKPRRLG
jgi:small subunit ribosomal protein S11